MVDIGKIFVLQWLVGTGEKMWQITGRKRWPLSGSSLRQSALEWPERSFTYQMVNWKVNGQFLASWDTIGHLPLLSYLHNIIFDSELSKDIIWLQTPTFPSVAFRVFAIGYPHIIFLCFWSWPFSQFLLHLI